MSRENVEVVRSVYAGFSELARKGELASFVAEHWDPDCEYEPVEETATIRGHDALIRWAERWLEAWEEYWDEIDEIIDVGESVVAAITVHGRGRDSALEISQRLFHVMELRDRRILRMREYLDRHQALEAAGLRE
jgi:ketosteroid isomerase-like protein